MFNYNFFQVRYLNKAVKSENYNLGRIISSIFHYSSG